MLILSADDVRATLSMRDAIAAMRAAFTALANREVAMPARTHLDVAAHDGVTLVMPGLAQGDDEALAVKVVSVFPRNVEQDLARIQAAVMVFNPTTGQPVALLEGSALTAIRTAAVSGLATDCLAREDSRVLGIVGAGVQARTHIEAVCCVRPIEEVRIYGPTPARVEKLAAKIGMLPWSPANVLAATSADEAVTGADVICTVSTASQPTFADASVKPTAHLNAVGSYQPHVVEIPSATVVRSRVAVDLREAALEEAGDLIQPLNAGLIGEDHIHAELGEIVTGSKPGRESDDQLTLFKSVGLAVQDVLAAKTCVEKAREMGLGQAVDWS